MIHQHGKNRLMFPMVKILAVQDAKHGVLK